MGLTTKKLDIFGKKLPAWIFVAALVVVGAGAATGLVLKDQVNGTTTIAVSQAIRVTAPYSDFDGDGFMDGDQDEFLGTADDDGMAFAAHFEANNGDIVIFYLDVYNHGGNADETVVLLTLDIPDGLTINIEDWIGDDTHNAVRINYNQWKFAVDAGLGADDSDSNTLCVVIAIEDAQPTGFYQLQGTLVPVNV